MLRQINIIGFQFLAINRNLLEIISSKPFYIKHVHKLFFNEVTGVANESASFQGWRSVMWQRCVSSVRKVGFVFRFGMRARAWAVNSLTAAMREDLQGHCQAFSSTRLLLESAERSIFFLISSYTLWPRGAHGGRAGRSVWRRR